MVMEEKVKPDVKQAEVHPFDEPHPHDRDFSDFQSPHEASVDRLVAAIDRAYHRPVLMVWRSFWQGVFTAIGLSVGYALVVIILVYTFHALGGIELLQPSLTKIQEMVIPKQLRDAANNATPSPTPTSLYSIPAN